MNDGLQLRLLEALNRENAYNKLREIALELRDQGQGKKVVEQTFQDLLHYVMEHGTEAEEDIIRDVLDIITGWCSKDTQLFPD